MKRQAVNPFLPLWEYIPDGEPHVFGDRIYLFGSHDVEGGTRYCAAGNYVCWSAPVDDLTDWRYEGVIFENKQDPYYVEGEPLDLYAPDVVQGNDGRYYLYYNPEASAEGASGHECIHVAVCDTPAGRYEYLGHVRSSDGSVFHPYLMGDPAVINDGGTIRLYCGWSLSMVAAGAHRGGGQRGGMMLPKPGDPEMNKKLAPIYQMLFKRSYDRVADLEYPLMGANTVELQDDMLTVASEMKRIVPGQFDTPDDSSFKGHAFYEASSIRKINGTYYFIYSSENSNELCYAVSPYPDREFVYGGTIISNGDVGYRGRKPEDRLNQTANNHGSLECVNGQWYIFHHRQTHRSTFSRQACAEKVTIAPDGSIAQVECTSCGLNDGPLEARGTYSAGLACNLTNGHMPHITNTQIRDDIPYITHEDGTQIITGIRDGVRVGYKYFRFRGAATLHLLCRGDGEGGFTVRAGDAVCGEIAVSSADAWTDHSLELTAEGDLPLYLDYHGSGRFELLQIEFE